MSSVILRIEHVKIKTYYSRKLYLSRFVHVNSSISISTVDYTPSLLGGVVVRASDLCQEIASSVPS